MGEKLRFTGSLVKAVDHDGTTITVLKADGSTELKQHPNVKSLVAVQGPLRRERELGFTPALARACESWKRKRRMTSKTFKDRR